jgi:hypothetical protein
MAESQCNASERRSVSAVSVTQRGILDIDRDLLNQWISKDPHHRETTTPDFFYEKDTICNVYSDELGPVFFMRGEAMLDDGDKVIRLDIQFDNDQERRNAKMLIEVDRTFCAQAKAAGFKEIFFDSQSPKLIKFCKRALGFIEPEPGILRKRL